MEPQRTLQFQLTLNVSTLIPASWRERASTQECTVGILRYSHGSTTKTCNLVTLASELIAVQDKMGQMCLLKCWNDAEKEGSRLTHHNTLIPNVFFDSEQ